MLGHGVLLVSGFSNDLYSERQPHDRFAFAMGQIAAKTAVELLCRPNRNLIGTTWAIKTTDSMSARSRQRPPFRDFARDFVADREKAMRRSHGARIDLQVGFGSHSGVVTRTQGFD